MLAAQRQRHLDRHNRAMHESEARVTLAGIGWPPGRPWPALEPGQALARVAAQHRGGYLLHDGARSYAAQPAPAFLRRGLAAEARPVVGDFVVVAGSPAQIVGILPRHGLLQRAAAGERYARQPIAANVDTVCVLMGLDGDFNPARVLRYLALIEGSGATALLLLSKADRHPFDAERQSALAQALPADTPRLAINAKDDAAVRAQLAPWLLPGATLALVGSSGAGKSTLTNSLLGHTAQATAAVRAHDSRGRHTTTHRALLALPGGACLIDTPGMRELKLTGTEDLQQYADIAALARQCRFSDCTHGNEPACAVRTALQSGELAAARWQAWCKLSAERDAQEAALEARLQGHARPATRLLGRRQRER